MTGLRAGQLRHRIRIDELLVALDDDGRKSETWTPVRDSLLPAEIKALSGRELVAAQAVQAKVATRIKVRFRDWIQPRMSAVHRGLRYNIEAVIPDPDSGRTWLTLSCTSGVHAES